MVWTRDRAVTDGKGGGGYDNRRRRHGHRCKCDVNGVVVMRLSQ